MPSDDFEYADLTALATGGWSLTDTMSGVGTASMSTGRFVDGGTSLRMDIVGSTASSQDFYYSRTFTGLAPSTTYTASLSVWENEEAEGSTGIGCGLEVVGGTSQYVEQDGTVAAWQRFYATGITNGSGELTVNVGFFHSLIGGTYDREAYFDALTVEPSGKWNDVLFEAGIMSVAGVRVGYSLGGLHFDVEKTVLSYDVEGRVTPLVGQDTVVAVKARFTGTLITANSQVRGLIEPGASTATDGAETVYTPKAGRTVFSSGDYLTDVRVTWRRLGGGFLEVRFPKAICLKWGIDGKDRAEATIPVEIEARSASSLTTLPYTVALID